MKTLRQNLVTLGAAALSAAALSAAAGAAHAESPCNGLSGYYGNVTAIVVGQDGKTVNLTLANGRPNAYGTCSGGNLTVTFPDDRTLTGTFDGKTIRWSNNTTWSKQ
ncbi:hypothetical protein [Phenylobacterium aquaticum]|uniref:hypothetical protein n=1 Tax=Phenylobacterium aquaticum TaxID=1763816 RepID=UPI001F5DB8B0|nr:hypothetical protein [Phenylobacterium aquaticum]MCI3133435.1 hypothetical protein [Phenylobacterium aquaticum]